MGLHSVVTDGHIYACRNWVGLTFIMHNYTTRLVSFSVELNRYEVEQPPYGTVNVYRVGETLLDTGHMASTETLADLIDLESVSQVVLTHAHPDHAGGSLSTPELASRPHTVFEGNERIMREYDTYLQAVHEELFRVGTAIDRAAIDAVAEIHFPRGDYCCEKLDIERVVTDGEELEIGGHRCEVIHTPGHNHEHMALYHEKSEILFSADLVSPNGYFLYGPLTADIGAYERSLRRIQAYDPARLAPGHGPLIENPQRRIDDALAKSSQARNAIRQMVTSARGRVTAQQVAREVFDATATNVGFLVFVAWAYLRHLESDGHLQLRVTDEGVCASAE